MVCQWSRRQLPFQNGSYRFRTAVTVPERHMPWYVSGRGGTCHRPLNDLGVSHTADGPQLIDCRRQGERTVRSQMRYSLTLPIALSTRIRSRAIACVFRASSSVNCAVVRDKLISNIIVSASVHLKHLSTYLNGHIWVKVLI